MRLRDMKNCKSLVCLIVLLSDLMNFLVSIVLYVFAQLNSLIGNTVHHIRMCKYQYDAHYVRYNSINRLHMKNIIYYIRSKISNSKNVYVI